MVQRENFTFSELEQWLNTHRVTEIECLVPDLTGVARGKILPREKFTEDRGMRLPEAVVAMGVTGFALGGRAEDGCHVVVALHIRLGSEVEVATIRLRFSGKSVLQVLFGLAAFQ